MLFIKFLLLVHDLFVDTLHMVHNITKILLISGGKYLIDSKFLKKLRMAILQKMTKLIFYI